MIQNSSNVAIGSGTGLLSNVIANNDTGVAIAGFGSDGVSIRGNSIYNNQGLGIDLGFDGVLQANDAGDIDTGANNLQNWAILQSVSISASGDLTYEFDTSTLVPGLYSVDFFANSEGDDGASGGGRYLGSAILAANGGTVVDTITGVTLQVGEFVTTTVATAHIYRLIILSFLMVQQSLPLNFS